MHKLPLSLALPILPRNLPRPLNPILIDTQPLQAHRPPSMDFIRADPHLSPKPKAHSVRHPCAGIPEHAGAVHAVEEALCDGCVGREDGVGVVRGVGVDVRGGEVDGCGGGGGGGEGLDGEDEVEEFGCVVGFGGVLQDDGLRFW